jgi:hypothetical protein
MSLFFLVRPFEVNEWAFASAYWHLGIVLLYVLAT